MGSLDDYATAEAPSTSADRVDGYGHTVSCDAEHMLDGDASTCWRRDRSGTSWWGNSRTKPPTRVSWPSSSGQIVGDRTVHELEHLAAQLR